jgi:hypothetical protein
LNTIYYTGSEEEWNSINISNGNDLLASATIYYYSESAPTADGNYWHYDTDKTTPVVWLKTEE